MPSLSTQIDNAAFVTPLVQQSLERIKQRIIQNMSANHRNASGHSVDSLKVVTTGNGGALYGKQSFWVMERGRKAGKIPGNMRTFADIISQWILDKGISITSNPPSSNPDIERIRAARAIAWFISQKGTSIHRMRAPQDIYSRVIDEEFQTLSQKILVQFGSSVTYIHEKFAQPTN